MFKLAKNTINKVSIVFKPFSKKNFELSLSYWVFSFEVIFILILVLNYHFIEKQSNKRDLVRPIGSSNFEIIFTSLGKPIAI